MLPVIAFLLAPDWWNQYDAALVLGTGMHALVVRLGKFGWLVGVIALGIGARHVDLAVQKAEPKELRDARFDAQGLRN